MDQALLECVPSSADYLDRSVTSGRASAVMQQQQRCSSRMQRNFIDINTAISSIATQTNHNELPPAKVGNVPRHSEEGGGVLVAVAAAAMVPCAQDDSSAAIEDESSSHDSTGSSVKKFPKTLANSFSKPSISEEDSN